MSEVYECPTCHHSSNVYWHRVTPGIVGALIKVKQAVIAKGEYSIHNRKDMDGTPYELTKNEAANFTMLRYHGLVAHDKERGAGYWILTHRGSEFLKGNIAIPRRVQVMNNRVIDREDEQVTIKDVYGQVPYFDDIDTIERERQSLELTQTGLFA